MRQQLLEWLRKYEEGDFTYIEDGFPPVISHAEGYHVYDTEGNRYVDLTAFFGVSILGHSPAFIKEEAEKGFFHGLGDFIPSEPKILLLKRLSELLGGDWKGLLLQDGADAVEACLRTAYLLKGSRKFIAFKGAYHGLSLGSLSATWKKHFRGKFEELLPFEVEFVDFSPEGVEQAEKLLSRGDFAGIIVEPVQGRAGIRICRWLARLRELASAYSAVLIFDEIFTGFAKTGAMFAKDRFGVEPDLIALGKALSGAFPLSACMGRGEVMDVWGVSSGEASYTFTFSGNPFFCRVALRNLDEMEKLSAVERARQMEAFFREALQPLQRKTAVKEIRGIGSLWGIELEGEGSAFRLCKKLLLKGYLTLPSGDAGQVLEITPPLIVPFQELEAFIKVLEDELSAL